MDSYEGMTTLTDMFSYRYALVWHISRMTIIGLWHRVIECCLPGSGCQRIAIGLSIECHRAIWTKDGLAKWRMHAPSCLNELIKMDIVSPLRKKLTLKHTIAQTVESHAQSG